MILSACTENIFNCFGYEDGIKRAAEAGFDALDFSMFKNLNNPEWSEENYKITAEFLKSAAKKNGIYFNQAHAPFPSYKINDDEYNKNIHSQIVRSIKIAGVLGASQIIVHPFVFCGEPEQLKHNIDFYNTFIPYCKEYSIKIAIENMWGRYNGSNKIISNVCSLGDQLALYYDHLDPEYFTVCLDIGHTILVGQNPSDAIRQIGRKRLGALHIHDNDGARDMHTIPYQGILDWNAITKALGEINYQGDFTYEVSGEFICRYEDKPALMVKVLELLASTGRHLINKIENHRPKEK